MRKTLSGLLFVFFVGLLAPAQTLAGGSGGGGSQPPAIPPAVAAQLTSNLDVGSDHSTPGDFAVGQTSPYPMDLDGQGEVTADGEFLYRVPLWTPGGPNGHAPQLAVNYRTRRGIGNLGRGWQLSMGQSMITRCHKAYAPDGFAERPNYDDDTDAFCLDGERLVRAAHSCETGVAFQRMINPNERVCARKSGDAIVAWTVESPTGEVSYYGLTSETWPELGTGIMLVGDGKRFGWVRTLSRDAFGNDIRYLYTRYLDYAGLSDDYNLPTEAWLGPEPRLEAIYYACEDESLASCARRIELQISTYVGTVFGNPIYTTPNEDRPRYFEGYRLGHRLRYKRVHMYVGDTRVRTVYVDDLDGEHAQLRSIKQCTEDVCNPPLRFVYEETGQRQLVQESIPVVEDAIWSNRQLVQVQDDFSGRRLLQRAGTSDMSFVMNSAGDVVSSRAGNVNGPTSTRIWASADLDGDGRTEHVEGELDRIPLFSPAQGGALGGFKTKAGTFGIRDPDTGQLQVPPGNPNDWRYIEGVGIGDFDGDGRQDVAIHRYVQGSGLVLWRPQDGTIEVLETERGVSSPLVVGDYTHFPFVVPDGNQSIVYFGDVDGVRGDEIILHYYDSSRLLIYSAQHLGANSGCAPNFANMSGCVSLYSGTEPRRFFLGDFNGDTFIDVAVGLDDTACEVINPFPGTLDACDFVDLDVYYNDGGPHFVGQNNWRKRTYADFLLAGRPAAAIDYDLDGRTDLLQFEHETARLIVRRLDSLGGWDSELLAGMCPTAEELQNGTSLPVDCAGVQTSPRRCACVYDSGGSSPTCLVNACAGGFEIPPRSFYALHHDFDHDGVPELVLDMQDEVIVNRLADHRMRGLTAVVRGGDASTGTGGDVLEEIAYAQASEGLLDSTRGYAPPTSCPADKACTPPPALRNVVEHTIVHDSSRHDPTFYRYSDLRVDRRSAHSEGYGTCTKTSPHAATGNDVSLTQWYGRRGDEDEWTRAHLFPGWVTTAYTYFGDTGRVVTAQHTLDTAIEYYPQWVRSAHPYVSGSVITTRQGGQVVQTDTGSRVEDWLGNLQQSSSSTKLEETAFGDLSSYPLEVRERIRAQTAAAASQTRTVNWPSSEDDLFRGYWTSGSVEQTSAVCAARAQGALGGLSTVPADDLDCSVHEVVQSDPEFDYRVLTRVTETVSGSRGSDDVTTVHYLDGFGNITGVSVFGERAEELDASGQILAVVSEERTTSRGYDALGIYPILEVNGVGHETATVWNTWVDQPVYVVEPDGTGTATQPDAFGRPIKVVPPDQNIATISRAWGAFPPYASSRVETTYGDGHQVTTFGGRRGEAHHAEERSSLGQTIYTDVKRDFSYRVNGANLPKLHQNQNPARYRKLDLFDRVEWRDTPDDREYLVHDYRHEQITDGMGHVSHRFADAQGNEIAFIDRLGTPRATYHRPDGQIQVVQEDGILRETRTFSGSLMTSRTSAEEGTTHYAYDVAGNPTVMVKPDGVVERRTYDAASRVQQVAMTGDSGSIAWDFYYDEDPAAIGKLSRAVSDNGITTEYIYGLGTGKIRTIRRHFPPELGGGMLATSMHYQGHGRLGDVYFNQDDLPQVEAHYYYTSGSAPTSVKMKEVGSNFQLVWNVEEVAPENHPVRSTLGNGLRETRVDDPFSRRLAVLELADSGGSVVDAFDYTYTDNGDVSSSGRTGQLFQHDWRYEVDAESRLTRWHDDDAGRLNGGWDLDVHGNRTYQEERGSPTSGLVPTVVAASTATNQLQTLAGGLVNHDDAGRLTDGPGKDYQYSVAGLPASVAIVPRSLAYAVVSPELDGRELAVVQDDYVTHQFLGGQQVRLQGGAASRKITIPLTDTVVAEVSQSSTDYEVNYLHGDGLGSFVTFTNEAGDTASGVDRSPFGAVFDEVGSYEGSLGFHGGLTVLADEGLTPFGPRLYDYGLGRFTSPDELDGTAGENTWNRYEYGRSNPLRWGDTSGLNAGPHVGGGCAAASGSCGGGSGSQGPSSGAGRGGWGQGALNSNSGQPPDGGQQLDSMNQQTYDMQKADRESLEEDEDWVNLAMSQMGSRFGLGNLPYPSVSTPSVVQDDALRASLSELRNAQVDANATAAGVQLETLSYLWLGGGVLKIGKSLGDGALQTAVRFFYDPRSFRTISRGYWASRGPAAGSSLHHWLFPQRATWVPQGIRNAGFNLVQLPAMQGVFHRSLGLNQWMGFARNWGPAAARQAASVENGIRVGIPAAAGGSGYLGYQFGSYQYRLDWR